MTGCFDCDLRTTLSRHNILNTTLSNLSSLSLANVHSLQFCDLQSLLEPNKGNLKQLNINGCNQLGTASTLTLGDLGYLKEIVTLDLGDCDIDDKNIESLIGHLPRLRDLALEHTKITGVGVKAVVFKPNDKLEHLVLHNCHGVSPDAIEFARARGVKVECYFPDAARKCKRVRLE